MSAAQMPQYTDIMKSLTGSLAPPDQSQNMAGIFGSNPAVAAFSNMMNQANQANAARGQGILSLLAGQGTAQMQMNQQNLKQQQGGIAQSMMSKGLANTSVGDNLNQEAVNQTNLANEDVTEKSAMNVANMANSFTQQAPSMDLLAGLMSKASSAPTGNPMGYTGAISSSASGESRQRNDGMWVSPGGQVSPYPTR